ncbi:MAG: GntR family transcriptional regulator [Victivallaceae bacterium]
MIQIAKKSLVKQVKDRTVEMINAQKLAPGDKIMSQNELAEIFKVAAPTVCRALNELTCEGILYRIKGKGTFVADTTVLKTQEPAPPPIDNGGFYSNMQYTIGIFPFENYYGHDYLMGLAEGLTAGLIKNQVNFKYINSFELEHKKMSLLEYMFQHQVDGLIMTSIGTQKERQYIEDVRQNGFSHVLINRTLPGSDSVVCDHYNGASQLFDLLIGMGHRRIAFVSARHANEPTCERRRAYYDVMLKHNLPTDECSNVEFTGEFDLSKNVEFLKQHPEITAVFVNGGALQNKLLETLANNGIKVPEQLSIVVFDEARAKPEFGIMTCAKQPLQMMGKTAVDVLMKKMKFNASGQINLIYPPEIIHGSSCKIISNLTK